MTGRISIGQLKWVGLWVAAFTFGLLSVWLGRRPPGLSFAAASPLNTALYLAGGWTAAGIGLVAWNRSPMRRLGPLLAMTGAGWFLSTWTNPGTGAALIFTVGIVLAAASEALVAHLILVYPGQTFHGPADRVIVYGAYATNILLLGLLPAMLAPPAANGCSSCPQDLVALGTVPGVAATIRRIGLVLAALWASAAIMQLVRRMLRASRPARVVGLPVVVPGSVFIGLFAIRTIHVLPEGADGLGEINTMLWQGQALALIALALGVASESFRAGRTRARVAGLVVELAGSPRSGGLRDRLSVLLDDPGLVLAYPIGDDQFIDGMGRSISPNAGPARSITPLARDGEIVAYLGHRTGLQDDPGQMDELVRAARLALENERLQAVARARLADLRASRAQVVAASDAERRKLERNLHDGAQQRLVSLAIAFRLLRARLASESAPVATGSAIDALDEAEAELKAAISDLRDVAHGLYPAALAEEGLAASVEALVERSTTRMTIEAMPEERFALAIESAAYLLIAGVTGSGATETRIDVRHLDAALTIGVVYDGDPTNLMTELEDRIGALDGMVTFSQSAGGLTSIQAEIPCAS